MIKETSNKYKYQYESFMGKGNMFVVKMRKEIYNQILDIKSLLLQDLFTHSHIHYKLCNISLTTTLSLPPILDLNPTA